MKLGVLTVPFFDKPLEEVLAYLSKLGVQAVELGTGGFTNDSHCRAKELLKDKSRILEMKELLKRYNMEISAFSCHGNPVHPQKEIANLAHEQYLDSIRLAEEFGVDTVVTFSGCPGDHQGAKYPNWVICPWPEDFLHILDYQWDDILIPYWQRAAETASASGVKIALEMHPGFCVYHTESLLRLRAAVGKTIGANYDPSHLFWQGMDPVASIRKLGDAIHYVHAKDCRIDEINTKEKGVLDTRHYGEEMKRSWIFRTVGYGHDAQVWKDMISALRMVGYQGVVSIEHEDSLMSVTEGIEKAISFLQQVMIQEEKTDMWWA